MSAVLLAAALAAASPPGESVCGPTSMVLRGLTRRYDERIIAIGDASMGGQLVVTSTRDGTTWTALRISPDGQTACVLAVGERWQDVRSAPGDES